MYRFGVIIAKVGRAVSCLRHSHGDGVRSIDFRGSAPTVPFLFPAPRSGSVMPARGVAL